VIVIGVTGSIGTGKSTTARMFAEESGGVWLSADQVVHDLYAPGGGAAAQVRRLAPYAVSGDGSVDRRLLRQRLRSEPGLLADLESALHPLVARARAGFLRQAEADSAEIAALEIPLLFETGAEAGLDAVVVASVSPAEQRRRVLARPGMDAATFDILLARQMPDSEKRRRADFVLWTGDGIEPARRQVRRILAALGREFAGPAGDAACA